MIQLFKNKQNFIKNFFLSVLSIILVIYFINISLNSNFLHTIFPIFKPFGMYLFLFVLLFSFAISVINRIHPKSLFSWIEKNYSRYKIYYFTIAIVCALCLSTLPLFICWSTACFNQNNLGGLYPIMDAQKYYEGAETLLYTGSLAVWDQNRPLNAVSIAGRLLITNFNFRETLILQALLFGISAFLAALAVSRTLGKCAGFIMFGSLLAISCFFLPDSLSDTFGIIFGCLSFALIWYGIFEMKVYAFYGGLFFLTIALLGRMGPLIIIPALILYSGYIFKKHNLYNKHVSFFSFIVCCCGFLFNFCITFIFGDGKGMSFGNYAIILYQLASGAPDWQQYMTDYPYEAHNFSDHQLYAFLYQKSWEIISHNPLQFSLTILKGFISEPIRMINQFYYFLTNPQNPSFFNITIYYVFCAILIFSLIIFLKFSHDKRIRNLMVVIILGTYFTLPFYFIDGGVRSLGAIFPYISLSVVLGTLVWGNPAWVQQKFTYIPSKSIFAWVIPIGIGFIIIASIILTLIIGPIISSGLTKLPSHIEHISCQSNESSFVIRFDPGMPKIEILNISDTRHTFSPYIQKDDFMESNRFNYTYKLYYDFDNFPENNEYPKLFLGYDLVSHFSYYILAPRNFTVDERKYLSFCAQYTNKSGLINSAYEIDTKSITKL